MSFYKLNKIVEDDKFEIIRGMRDYGLTFHLVNKTLLKLKFNVSSIGYQYWITAIILYKKNYYKYDNSIEKIYNDVAEEHKTTRSRVERSMRTARLTATEEIQKYFNYYNKLTNKTVLELLSRCFLFIGRKEN